MALSPSVPASYFVTVTPEVLAAGGSGLVLNGLLLTSGTRSPIGTVQSYASATAVAAYFGASSNEAAFAVQYFNGFTNSNQKPSALLIAQYPETAVSAWLRGASVASLSLIALQAISGSLAVTVDGYTRTAAAINLSTAVSFSTAAAMIQTALNASLPAGGTSTASTIAINSVTGSITGTILNVTAVATGLLAVGQTITGGATLAGTTITGLGTGTGGIGTYTVSQSQTVTSTTLTASGGTLTVGGTVTGSWAVGQTVTGGTTAAGTVITGLGTGSGGAGTYLVSVAQTVASAALASTATAVAVAYDSTSGAFTITSGAMGAASTITAPTGIVATALGLTTAAGAVTSQGSAAAVPSTYMTALTQITTNWAAFALLWQASTSENLAFATWNNGQNNRFMFIGWDTDVTITGASSSYTGLGAQVAAASLSGIHLVYTPNNGFLAAAFALSYAPCLLWTQQNGRWTMAYRQTSGLVADVTNSTALSNIVANGYNVYTPVATANQQFTWYWPGSVSGAFSWADTYVNQIWLNSQFQLDMVQLLTQVGQIPYNTDGDTLMKASVASTITQAGNFGVFRSGVTLSSLQTQEVNNMAGRSIASTLASQGWYLLSNAAGTATSVRQVRGSPPFMFFYVDGESVQTLNMQSVVLQ